MRKSVKTSKSDFSIIFEEMEKYRSGNPSNYEYDLNEDDLKNDCDIREFSEICRQINIGDSNSIVFLTFS
jgi:hypothetical protein